MFRSFSFITLEVLARAESIGYTWSISDVPVSSKRGRRAIGSRLLLIRAVHSLAGEEPHYDKLSRNIVNGYEAAFLYCFVWMFKIVRRL